MNIGFTQLIPRVGVPLQLQSPIPTRIRTYNPYTGIPGPSFSNFHHDTISHNEEEHVVAEHRGATTGVVTTISGKKSEVLKIRRVLEVWENARARQNAQHMAVVNTTATVQLDSDEPLVSAVVNTASQQLGGNAEFELIPRF